MLILIILLPLIICLVVFSLYGGYIFWRAITREKILQERARFRYPADPLGNYEVYFNPETDVLVRPRPGNKAFPELPAVNQSLPTARKSADRPLVINYRSTPALEDSERSIEPNVLSENDVHGQLSEAKARGEAKQGAILLYTGVTKGGSKAWKDWSEIWDGL